MYSKLDVWVWSLGRIYHRGSDFPWVVFVLKLNASSPDFHRHLSRQLRVWSIQHLLIDYFLKLKKKILIVANCLTKFWKFPQEYSRKSNFSTKIVDKFNSQLEIPMFIFLPPYFTFFSANEGHKPRSSKQTCSFRPESCRNKSIPLRKKTFFRA